ncbi:MAG TPA: sugar transferase [Nannocystaceae bacterium]|nr:sugar transferase [Nannocystaceae bacterium]
MFYQRYGKRIFDVAVAGTALVLAAPLLAATAIAVRVAIGSPVFFRQRRPGKDGEPFTLVKFRTMTDARGRDGVLLPDADRLPRFGKWLRATSLDELPELVNILKGEMSLVGPRPLLERYLTRYDARQARRHDVRPGLTGWAQINGRNAADWPTRLEHDVQYVERMSFAFDLKILWGTVKAVLRKDGISAPGEATVSEFQGKAA